MDGAATRLWSCKNPFISASFIVHNQLCGCILKRTELDRLSSPTEVCIMWLVLLMCSRVEECLRVTPVAPRRGSSPCQVFPTRLCRVRRRSPDRTDTTGRSCCQCERLHQPLGASVRFRLSCSQQTWHYNISSSRIALMCLVKMKPYPVIQEQTVLVRQCGNLDFNKRICPANHYLSAVVLGT